MNVINFALILRSLVLLKSIHGYNLPYERNWETKSLNSDVSSVETNRRDKYQHLLEELNAETQDFKNQEKEVLPADNDNLFAAMAEKKRAEIGALPMNGENLLDMQFADMEDMEEEEKEILSLDNERLLREQFADKADVQIDNNEPLASNYDAALATRDISINGLKQYVCKLSMGLVVRSSCFIVSVQQKDWYDAKRYCEEHDARLAEIRDSYTNIHLINYVKGATLLNEDQDLWLGGYDRGQEGHWRWAGSGQELSYTFWAPGEPNNYKNEDCLSLRNKGSNHYAWNDIECNDRRLFACEWSLA